MAADMARRSVLFTPGNRREMLVGAAESDADVLVFDLEDAVSPNRKAEARETVRSVLGDEDFDPDAECLVRVNPVGAEADRSERAYLADVRALAPVADAVDGVVLPKASGGEDVRRLAGQLRAHALPRTVVALVETAAGVQAAPEIAAAGATEAIVAGTEDLAADVGSSPTDDHSESVYARQRIVAAAAAADVDAIDTLWTNFEDVEGLRADAKDAAGLGFDGKLAIHPSQVPPINEAFTPDADQREWAQRVLAARDAAADDGVFAVDGEMIDAPLLARAEGILERARAAGVEIRDPGAEPQESE
jgi:citrate lyase subunit beta/citryl-CoA lyase